jgi:hypothetical protein
VWAGQRFDTDLDVRPSAEHHLLVVDEDRLSTYAPSELTLVVRVVNDSGGTATIASFNVGSEAGEPVWAEEKSAPVTVYTSEKFTLADPGTYRIWQKRLGTYSAGMTCSGTGYSDPWFGSTIEGMDGGVTLAPGASVTCENRERRQDPSNPFT